MMLGRRVIQMLDAVAGEGYETILARIPE